MPSRQRITLHGAVKSISEIFDNGTKVEVEIHFDECATYLSARMSLVMTPEQVYFEKGDSINVLVNIIR